MYIRLRAAQLPLEVGQTVALRRWWEVSSSPPHNRHDGVLASVATAWQLFGPFDAIAGFSEGGAVAHIVATAAAKQSAFPHPSFESSNAMFESLKAVLFFSA